MAWILSFFAFLSYLSCVISESPMTQAASASVRAGQTASLSCTPNGKVSYIAWYQQRAGQGPRYVHQNGQNRGVGIPDRFTASLSGNVGILTITNTQGEDEAGYYCGTWYHSINAFIFGGGTSLTVLVPGKPIVPPSVNVFPPSPEELKGDKATVVCLVDGFYPGTVQVTWEADGTPISSGVETTKPTKLNDKFVASSYLSMAKNVWERYDAVTCKVTHEGQTFPKVVKRSECA